MKESKYPYPPGHIKSVIDGCLSLDQQIQAGIQKRLLKKANKILSGTGFNVETHRDRIIKLMLSENYRSETLTMVRTLEYAINSLVYMQKRYNEIAEDSCSEDRFSCSLKALAIAECVDFLNRLKSVKEDQL